MKDIERFLLGIVLGAFIMNTNIIIQIKAILFDFLIGSTNRRKAEKIKHEATRWQKFVSMSYIRPYLIQDINAFERYYRFYIIYLWSLLPQVLLAYILIFIVGIDMKDVYFCYMTFYLVLLVVFGILNNRFGMPSPYASRHRKKNGKK